MFISTKIPMLKLNVMVFGVGSLGRLGQEGGTLMNKIHDLIEESYLGLFHQLRMNMKSAVCNREDGLTATVLVPSSQISSLQNGEKYSFVL
jgi:hypothetical protein